MTQRPTGKDGFPRPNTSASRPYWNGTCVVCWHPDARMTLTRNGNWKIDCTHCRTILFLNSNEAQNLWRGFQALGGSPEGESFKMALVEAAHEASRS